MPSDLDGNWSKDPVFDSIAEEDFHEIDLKYARRRAQVCIASGFLQPSEYDQFTEEEVNIWIEILNKRK